MRDDRYIYLYCIKCGPFYKIGIAVDVDRRVHGFRIGNPFKIKRQFSRPINKHHARFVEMEVHKALAAWKHHGEWFSAPMREIRRAVTAAAKQVPGREDARLAWLEKCEAGDDDLCGFEVESGAQGEETIGTEELLEID